MAQNKLQAPKGTQDVLPADAAKWRTVEAIARNVAASYNYGEIRTPVMESSDLFHRGVGETSDMVRKETYDFTDRGDRKLTLRPEGTAGVVRAVIEHGLVDQPGSRVKVFYIGANFRYERPQKGRYHIHHQFGVEAFGVAGPEQDAECIRLQMDFYRRCGVKDLALRVNSLGDKESKQRYRDLLVAFLLPHAGKLSDDSQRRLNENPLRILDSKDPRDIEACQGAPSSMEALTDASRAHFDRVCAILRDSELDFTIDSKLVRGFDYYTGTLWEVTAGGLGSQAAIGGGGRYDNLVEQLGGKPTPGVGFGSGLERLLLALDAQGVGVPPDVKPLVWIAYHGDAARNASMTLAHDLREAGFCVDLDLTGRKIAKQFAMADREGAKVCLILGEDELASNSVQLKDLSTGQQKSVTRGQLNSQLRGALL